jgi:hypothetical protein
MALPIWALFMNKVYNDASLGITQDDVFEKPADYAGDIECVDILDSSNSNEMEIPEEIY